MLSQKSCIKNYVKLKSGSIISNILKFKILKFKTSRSQKCNVIFLDNNDFVLECFYNGRQVYDQ